MLLILHWNQMPLIRIWSKFRILGFLQYCIQLWIRPVLFSPYRGLSLICPVLNSPSLEFNYIILSVWFKLPSFEFTLRPEGKNKMRAKFSLYTVFEFVVLPKTSCSECRFDAWRLVSLFTTQHLYKGWQIMQHCTEYKWNLLSIAVNIISWSERNSFYLSNCLILTIKSECTHVYTNLLHNKLNMISIIYISLLQQSQCAITWTSSVLCIHTTGW